MNIPSNSSFRLEFKLVQHPSDCTLSKASRYHPLAIRLTSLLQRRARVGCADAMSSTQMPLIVVLGPVYRNLVRSKKESLLRPINK